MHIYTCIYIHKLLHVHIYSSVYIHTHTHTHTHIYIHIHMYTHTYITCPVTWGCRIHRLHLCIEVRFPQRVSWI